MRARWVWISVAAVLAGVGGAALSQRYRTRAPAPAQRTSGAAVLSLAELTLTGSIRAQHVTEVSTAIGGNIDAFLADAGQDVYQGQVLARIGGTGLESAREAAASAEERAQDRVNRAESAVTAARVDESRADAAGERARLSLDRVQQVYARQQTLFKAGATPRLAYEKARREYESASQEFEILDKATRAARDQVQNMLAQLDAAKKALAGSVQQLDEAQGDLAAAEVRSPVDGFVVARNGEAGKPPPVTGGLFQIATDLYALEVALDPSPAVLQRLRPGMQALVLILDLQSAAIPGDIKEIKGAQAIVEFGSPSPAIKPGMQAGVRLKLE